MKIFKCDKCLKIVDKAFDLYRGAPFGIPLELCKKCKAEVKKLLIKWISPELLAKETTK